MIIEFHKKILCLIFFSNVQKPSYMSSVKTKVTQDSPQASNQARRNRSYLSFEQHQVTVNMQVILCLFLISFLPYFHH